MVQPHEAIVLVSSSLTALTHPNYQRFLVSNGSLGDNYVKWDLILREASRLDAFTVYPSDVKATRAMPLAWPTGTPRASSTPVLSWPRSSSSQISKRPRQIGTELSHGRSKPSSRYHFKMAKQPYLGNRFSPGCDEADIAGPKHRPSMWTLGGISLLFPGVPFNSVERMPFHTEPTDPLRPTFVPARRGLSLAVKRAFAFTLTAMISGTMHEAHLRAPPVTLGETAPSQNYPPHSVSIQINGPGV